MSKISIEELEAVLLQRHVDPNQIKDIIKDCELVAEELKQDKTSVPKTKSEYVIIIYDKEGTLDGKELTGWIVQQKSGADASLIMGKLKDATTAQNEAAKRKKSRINNLLSMFMALKPKFLKDKEIKIKTKELTRVLIAKSDSQPQPES